MPEPSSLLVLAPNWLGDAVMGLPALADVRRAHPRARVVVAARPSVAPLYGMVPGIDATVELRWRGSVVDGDAMRDDARRIAAEHAEVTILFPNSFAAAWLVRRAGIGERWGYAADARSILLTRAVRRPRGSQHQALYYQHLVRELGMPTGELDPVIAVPAAAAAEADDLLASRGCDQSRPLIAMAPGAAYGTAKRWLPRHFASLVTRLAREVGAQCALVGTAADAGAARAVIDAADAAARESVFDLTGATTLPVLAAVMCRAAACVSNDSGAMHLAGAVGTPLAAIFGPTRDRETSPLARKGGRTEVIVHDVWCRPCMLRTCPIDHRCMTRLQPDRVFAVVRELMEACP